MISTKHKWMLHDHRREEKPQMNATWSVWNTNECRMVITKHKWMSRDQYKTQMNVTWTVQNTSICHIINAKHNFAVYPMRNQIGLHLLIYLLLLWVMWQRNGPNLHNCTLGSRTLTHGLGFAPTILINGIPVWNFEQLWWNNYRGKHKLYGSFQSGI